jgi:hypothetical protein
MKKIMITTVLGLVTMGMTKASPIFQNNTTDQQNAAAYEQYQTMGTEPGAPGDTPAPIDDYIPVLLIAGVGIALYTANKRRKITEM